MYQPALVEYLRFSPSMMDYRTSQLEHYLLPLSQSSEFEWIFWYPCQNRIESLYGHAHGALDLRRLTTHSTTLATAMWRHSITDDHMTSSDVIMLSFIVTVSVTNQHQLKMSHQNATVSTRVDLCLTKHIYLKTRRSNVSRHHTRHHLDGTSPTQMKIAQLVMI